MPAKDNRPAAPFPRVSRLKAVGVAVMTAAAFSSASAAGLGKITVLSGLGQPLNAEIELTSVGRDEANSLAVKLASVEAFRQANIEVNPALYSLRFAVEQRAGNYVVRITTAQPLNEPFVDLLLEVSASNSKLVREYTFLLDPPELRRPQAAQTAQAPAARSTTAQAAIAQGATAQPEAPLRSAAAARNRAAERAEARAQARAARANARSAAAPSTPPARSASAPAAGNAAGEVQVKSGDTLGRIAAEVKPEGVSLDQMLVALYRANPEAFAGNNMNRLRAGQILKVPDSEAAGALGQAEAHGVIVAQAADFNTYRSKLAGQVAVAAPRAATEGSQAVGGKITSRVQEQANPANAARDKLTVSRSGTGRAGEGEDKIAAEKANADAQARVRELEKNVGDLQKLLELKNQGLADRQQAAKGATPATGAAAVPPLASNAASTASGAAAPAGAPAAPASANPTQAAPSTTPAAGAAEASTPAASAPAASPATPTVAATPPAKPAKPKFVAPPPPPPPSLMGELLDNPKLLGVGGLLLAALAGFGLHLGNKRRQLKKRFSDSAILSETDLRTNSLFGTTGGQSVDTSSVFNSSFTPSASQLDTNEVDPVAEADVYIAYGRDAQAEEILKEALRTQPDRHAVRLKLLEIYASRKDLRAFDTVASELYSMTKGDCPEWPQAVELGAAIDPKNPLYANALGKPAGKAPAAKSDDLDLDALLNTTSGGHHEDEAGQALVFDDDAPAPAEKMPPAAVVATAAAATVASLAAAPAADAAPAVSEHVMEFSAPQVPSALAAATPAPEPALDEGDGNTLDFEFDLDQLGDKEAVDAKPVAVTHAAVPAVPLLEEEALDAPTAKESTPAALDFNFDLLKPVSSMQSAVPTMQMPVDEDFDDLEELHVTAPALDTPQPAPLDFDMSSINLDLDAPSSAPLSAPSPAASPAPAPAAASGASSAEMATKLDLALAYQEIGDAEGARELLDEVLKGGNRDQVEKAQSLLEKLT
ncbi:MAG: fimV [Paucimonas sp.]|nr:fimV [Paucimonas sp.]